MVSKMIFATLALLVLINVMLLIRIVYTGRKEKMRALALIKNKHSWEILKKIYEDFVVRK